MTDLEARIRTLEQIGLRLRSRLRHTEDDAGLLLQQVGELAQAGAIPPTTTPATGPKVLIWTGGMDSQFSPTLCATAAGIWTAQGATVDTLSSGTPTLSDYRLIWVPVPRSLAIATDLDAWLSVPARRLLLSGENQTSFSLSNAYTNSLLAGWGFSVALSATNVLPAGTLVTATAESDPLTASVADIQAVFGVGVSGGTALSKRSGSTWLAHETRTSGAQVVLAGDSNYLTNQTISGTAFNCATHNTQLIKNFYTVGL